MRVNVTYSIELDEIKQLVRELLLKAEDDLQELQELFLKVKVDIEKDKDQNVATLLKECRSSLSSLDHNIFDAGNILSGYQQTSLRIEREQQKTPTNFEEITGGEQSNESG